MKWFNYLCFDIFICSFPIHINCTWEYFKASTCVLTWNKKNEKYIDTFHGICCPCYILLYRMYFATLNVKKDMMFIMRDNYVRKPSPMKYEMRLLIISFVCLFLHKLKKILRVVSHSIFFSITRTLTISIFLICVSQRCKCLIYIKGFQIFCYCLWFQNSTLDNLKWGLLYTTDF